VLLTIEEMAKHVLENLKPEFAAHVKPGDILIAGKHFGQSSGRAVAPKAIKATGVSVVVVEYASRLFFRNCFEIGLPLMECPGIAGAFTDGDVVNADMESGTVINQTTGKTFQARPADPFLMKMLKAGGLIPMASEIENM
jgi:3-isopropylmalate/(R)-2-methylmalate dehydratase small subunit